MHENGNVNATEYRNATENHAHGSGLTKVANDNLDEETMTSAGKSSVLRKKNTFLPTSMTDRLHHALRWTRRWLLFMESAAAAAAYCDRCLLQLGAGVSMQRESQQKSRSAARQTPLSVLFFQFYFSFENITSNTLEVKSRILSRHACVLRESVNARRRLVCRESPAN